MTHPLILDGQDAAVIAATVVDAFVDYAAIAPLPGVSQDTKDNLKWLATGACRIAATVFDWNPTDIEAGGHDLYAALAERARQLGDIPAGKPDAYDEYLDQLAAVVLAGPTETEHPPMPEPPPSAEKIARCDQCGLEYPVGTADVPVTSHPYTCDDCGGYVDVVDEDGETP